MAISEQCITQFFHQLSCALPQKWTRAVGSLRPAHVFYSLMIMAAEQTHGYRRVLEYLKRSVGDQLGWEFRPATSSLSEARRKLTPAQCRGAFQYVRRKCAAINASPKVAYKGFRLVSGDMTKLALPAYADLIEGFGCPRDAKGRTAPAPQANLTVFWDLGSNTPIDWRLKRCYTGENAAAREMFDQLDENDLFIADRGYPSRQHFKILSDQETKFLIRMTCGKSGAFKEVTAFRDDEDAWDQEVMLHEKNDRSGEPTIAIRLMKRKLTDGEIGIFATNLLNKNEFKRRALCDLYCYRWDIETAFAEMKVWHGLENFNARFTDGIHQEVAALMTFMLLSAELEATAREHHQLELTDDSSADPIEPPFRFNRKLIAECVGYLLIAGAKGQEAFDAEYDRCMKDLWLFRQKRKKNRKFERKAKSPNSKWKRSTYNSKSVKKASENATS